jgi:hypothetical protein
MNTALKSRYLLILSLSFLFFQNCKKKNEPVTEEPPVVKTPLTQADTEVRSTINVTYINTVVSDFAMMAGFLGERKLTNTFYSEIPGGSTGTTTATLDTAAKYMIMSFNDAKCQDGKRRSGSVIFDYGLKPQVFPNQSASAAYFRDPGFSCILSLSAYTVDGWSVETVPGFTTMIMNTLPNSAYDPQIQKIIWTIKGTLRFVNITDASKNMTWKGEITQTLENTSNVAVLPNKQSPINWSLAHVSYKGTVTGSADAGTTYIFAINAASPLQRDFTCSLPISFTPQPPKTEFHPFTDGVVSMNVSTSDKTRSLSYGTNGASACNNDAIMLVDDAAIPFSFK